MARSLETPIATRTNRLKLTPRGAPYHFTPVDPGISVGYRRITQGDGKWIIRVADGKGSSRQQVLTAVADDYQDADGVNVLTFMQAAAAARTRMRGGEDTGNDGRRDMPITNGEALAAYQAAQHDRRNATRVLKHLPEWLANMPVANTTQKDYLAFTKLLGGRGLAPASIKRTCKNFGAALTLAAEGDERITNHAAWRNGFAVKGKGAAGAAAINYASDSEILAVVAECYALDPALGLFVEVAAQTGSRPIQIARLQVASLQFNPPRLMMPAANKGKAKEGGKPPTPLPITHELAERLRKAAHGRKIVEALLLQSDGEPWCRSLNGVLLMTHKYRDSRHGAFTAITKRLGLSAEFSFYGLRHSSIIRQLQKNVPTRIVAAAHDTSVPILEAHYGSYILHFSDELVRAALLDTSAAPAGGKVLALRA